jgi:hypothetical protein
MTKAPNAHAPPKQTTLTALLEQGNHCYPNAPNALMQDLTLTELELRSLLYEFKTPSKYGDLWLRLKYSGSITVPYNPKFKRQKVIIAKGLNNLFHVDEYFKQWCLFTYDGLPEFYSVDNKENSTVAIHLDYSKLTTKQFE